MDIFGNVINDKRNLVMKKYELCTREELLVPAVSAGGLEEIRIVGIAARQFVMSVKIRTKRDRTYLSTRRQPRSPRIFKRVDIAIGVAHKLFGARKFLVLLESAR